MHAALAKKSYLISIKFVSKHFFLHFFTTLANKSPPSISSQEQGEAKKCQKQMLLQRSFKNKKEQKLWFGAWFGIVLVKLHSITGH